MKKLLFILILMFPFFASAEVLPENVSDCLTDLDFEYLEKEMLYKDYVERHRECYINNGGEKIMPANLNYEVSETSSVLADCQIAASNKLNSRTNECLSEYQAQLANAEITIDEFNDLYPSCSSGESLNIYKEEVSDCYDSADLDWVWEIPVLNKALTSVYDDYQWLSLEDGETLGFCLEKANSDYDLYEPSSEAQNIIADCFNKVGLTGVGNLYEKAAITIDCAKDSLGVKSLKDAQGLIVSATAEQKDYMEQCVIEKTMPFVTGIAMINIPFAVGGFQSAVYLQFLLFQLMLLFKRNKHVNVGLVYDSFTKRPLDLTIIRLFDSAKEKVISSFVTGKSGRYMFLTKPGEYKLNIRKDGFLFPSVLAPKVDTEYFGEKLEIQNEDEVISENIPLDAELNEKKAWVWNFQRRKEKLAFSIAMIAPVYSVTSLVFVQKLWLVVLAGVNIVFFLMFLRLRKKKAGPRFGFVKNEKGGKLKNVVVSMFETKFNKKLAYTVTDVWGRYYFPAVAGEYLLVAERKGYKKYEKRIEIKQKEVEEKNVSVNITLEK